MAHPQPQPVLWSAQSEPEEGSDPEGAGGGRPGPEWWLPLAWLRLRAWRVRRHGAAHPVADLIARGDWAALDGLMAELEREAS